tara:strand:- start:21 stop:407 length:387 start_codon:yes stop_codon:yes gene_type:complete
MASTTLSKDARVPGSVYKEADVDSSANLDIYGGGGKLLAVVANNSANGAASFFKMYETNAVNNTGITAPWLALKLPASASVTMVIAVDGGLAFSPELAMRCTTAQMVSSGNDGSAPGSNVPVTVYMRS